MVQSAVVLLRNGIALCIAVASALLPKSSHALDDKIHVKIVRVDVSHDDFCVTQQKTMLQDASNLKLAVLVETLVANPANDPFVEIFNVDQIKTILGSQQVNTSQMFGLVERVLESYSLFSMGFDLINRDDLKDIDLRKKIGNQIVSGYLLLNNEIRERLTAYYTTEIIRGNLLELQKGNNVSKTDPFLQKIKTIILPELKIAVDKAYPLTANEISEVKKKTKELTMPGIDEHFIRYQIFNRDKAMRKEIYRVLDAADFKNYEILIGDLHLVNLQAELLKKYGAENYDVKSENCTIKFDFSGGPRKGTPSGSKDY